MTDNYQEAGYGARTIGFGDKPAVLVVDFQRGFTDPRFPVGQSEGIQAAVDGAVKLLEVARRCRVPVASCYTAYDSERDMPLWKIESMYDGFFHGQPATELDPRIHDPDYDFTFCKSGPSIFFNTPVTTFLAKNRVDTLIVTGCTTSGCVRASIVDSFSHGYRTMVVADCCGDVEKGPHDDNLRDVGRRYADIVTAKEVCAYFEDIRTRNT